MRINRMTLLQTAIAMSVGLGVIYLQKRIGGPVGGIIPGVLGFLIGWLVTAAIAQDICQSAALAAEAPCQQRVAAKVAPA